MSVLTLYNCKPNPRMECCDATGLPVFSCITAASITPACSDESVSYHLVNNESQLGITGGMERVFCGAPGFRVVNVVDKGWIKFQWDRTNRPSFLEWAQQKQGRHPYFHFFLPTTALDPYLDINLRPAGTPNFGMRRRMVNFLIQWC